MGVLDMVCVYLGTKFDLDMVCGYEFKVTQYFFRILKTK